VSSGLIDEFVVRVSPRGDPDLEASRRLQLEELARGRRTAEVRTSSWQILLAFPSDSDVSTDPAGRVTVLLFGELFNDDMREARAVASAYRDRGDAFARDLNGSFTIVLVDPDEDRVAVVSDRANFRRAFHAVTANEHWFASSLWDLPTHRFEVDAVGVAWYVSNGVMHAGRTPYSGIRALRRASVHDVRPGGIETRGYWEYGFVVGDRPVADDVALDELWERLVAGVRRRCPGDAAPWLSLSGGYDSTAIALILSREAGVDDVRCLSYAREGARPDSDAHAAARLARTLGYRHTTYESYRGDLLAHIRDNARLGEGVAHRCDEVDAWTEAGAEAGAVAGGPGLPSLFVGDHLLGDAPERRERSRSRKPPGGLLSFDSVGWLRSALSEALLRTFAEGIRSDIEELRSRSAHLGDRARGFFYLDQRLGDTVFPWRQRFAGPAFSVRWPLMDNDVLDFMSSLPNSVRATHLYHRTLRRAFPEVYARPRATQPGYYLDLPGEIVAHHDRLRARLQETTSRLDDLLAPEIGLTLLGRVRRGHGAIGRLAERGSRVRRRMARAYRAWRAREDGGGAKSSVPETLRRLMILREALGPSSASRHQGVEPSS
jgi:hypothetical protein